MLVPNDGRPVRRSAAMSTALAPPPPRSSPHNASLDSPSPVPDRVSRLEYLRREELADAKHEWFHGEVREMSGVAYEHSLIAARIQELLIAAVRDRPLSVLPADMKVRIPAGAYVYPDLTVVPYPAELEPPIRPGGPRTVLLTPAVVIEALSPSAAATDRGEKLDGYRTIPSLTDYLIVDPTAPHVEHHRRTADGWTCARSTDRSATLTLIAADAALSLEKIYTVLDGAG